MTIDCALSNPHLKPEQGGHTCLSRYRRGLHPLHFLVARECSKIPSTCCHPEVSAGDQKTCLGPPSNVLNLGFLHLRQDVSVFLFSNILRPYQCGKYCQRGGIPTQTGRIRPSKLNFVDVASNPAERATSDQTRPSKTCFLTTYKLRTTKNKM